MQLTHVMRIAWPGVMLFFMSSLPCFWSDSDGVLVPVLVPVSLLFWRVEVGEVLAKPRLNLRI